MACFNANGPPSAVQPCPDESDMPGTTPQCRGQKTADDGLTNAVRERAAHLNAQPGRSTPICRANARGMAKSADSFERYRAALPSARAAEDLNQLGNAASSPVNQPCLRRLPLDAAGLNQALGILPDSPTAIRDDQLRNDDTGFRAAVYQSDSDGRYILVPRDTQPDSLADWQTNIENGRGEDTDQYRTMRELTGTLAQNPVPFDISGYSKGGGLAQEGGLMSSASSVYVFNSAGLNDASLKRTGQSSFDSLASRTTAFSAQGDFLTFMNNTKDPAQQLRNVEYLRAELGADPGKFHPLAITHSNPATEGKPDPAFDGDRKAFLDQLDGLIAERRANPDGPPIFPPVRAGSENVIPNSMSTTGSYLQARSDSPNLGKLAQHQISNVVGPMQTQVDTTRDNFKAFLAECG